AGGGPRRGARGRDRVAERRRLPGSRRLAGRRGRPGAPLAPRRGTGRRRGGARVLVWRGRLPRVRASRPSLDQKERRRVSPPPLVSPLARRLGGDVELDVHLHETSAPVAELTPRPTTGRVEDEDISGAVRVLDVLRR